MKGPAVNRIRTLAALAVVALTGVTACGGDDGDGAGAAAGTPAASSRQAGYTTPLKGVCPDTVVVQTNWWPEADHGGTYQLIGPGGKVDASKNTYTGPLGKTGIKLQ